MQGHDTLDRIASHRIASHRIASHRIASHRIASHRIASHRIASPVNCIQSCIDYVSHSWAVMGCVLLPESKIRTALQHRMG